MTAAISTETMTDSTTTSVTAPKAKQANSRLNVVTTERRHVPKPSGKPDPTAHLSATDVEALAREPGGREETRGEWYLRQMIGSANIKGNKAMHIMTGNLSHQIEHHLFPDLPSNRYAEIAPRVEEICSRYGLSYTSGSLPSQVGSAWKRVIKLSLPNDFSIHNTAKWVLRRRPPSEGGAAARK